MPGTLELSANAAERGNSQSYVDSSVNGPELQIAFNARYLADYYGVDDKSPFSTFHRYYHFGKSFDAIESEIAELKPDVVGISSLLPP